MKVAPKAEPEHKREKVSAFPLNVCQAALALCCHRCLCQITRPSDHSNSCFPWLQQDRLLTLHIFIYFPPLCRRRLHTIHRTKCPKKERVCNKRQRERNRLTWLCGDCQRKKKREWERKGDGGEERLDSIVVRGQKKMRRVMSCSPLRDGRGLVGFLLEPDVLSLSHEAPVSEWNLSVCLLGLVRDQAHTFTLLMPNLKVNLAATPVILLLHIHGETNL